MSSDEEEIQELLKLELGELDSLDFLDDFDEKPDNSKQPEKTQSPGPIKNVIESLPQGKAGIEELSNLPAVSKVEDNISLIISASSKGKALEDDITQISVAERTEEWKNSIQNQYESVIDQIHKIFFRLINNSKVRLDEIENLVDYFLSVFIKDRCILLNITNHRYTEKDHLYKHALHVCLLCLNIATAIGYSRKKVLQAGMSGLLADLGMLLVPEEVRFKPGKLNKFELYEIQKHPLISLSLLEEIHEFPLSIQIAIYQHHERNNGSGYLKQRKSHLIHDFAKIIGIADTYEALCNDRPHRKGMKPYNAIVKLLKMANKGLLDLNIMRKFVTYMSIFPVGSFVKLSDGKIGKVIEANHNNPSKPIITVLMMDSSQQLDKDSTFQVDTSRDMSVEIVAAMDLRPPDSQMMEGL